MLVGYLPRGGNLKGEQREVVAVCKLASRMTLVRLVCKRKKKLLRESNEKSDVFIKSFSVVNQR